MGQKSILSYFNKRGSENISGDNIKCDDNSGNNLGVKNKKICMLGTENGLSKGFKKESEEYYPSESKLREYFGDEWFEVLKDELRKPYFVNCMKKVQERRNYVKVYPPSDKMFSCFKATPLNKISVVILGQDPYHQPGQAMGLSFSVPKGVPIPPSLRNIYKEIGKGNPGHGDLTSWAEQGVFLLNSLLSVEEGKPMSHKDFGWDTFTSKVISHINKLERPVVFMLWGRSAQAKASNVCRKKHLVLESAHPSPLSQKKFIGCDHFNKCNEFLRKTQRPEVDWIRTKK
ncbi:Uracil-DNA glycosylase [Cryptosporidium ubiquitum]|uniref:Uracil-DNA glycosylase n=1 Tax=Cryptosporidium ubiquitum TaxID=857276 RepID=A0A1J4MJ51_9CRYT|nr:Uracil-DNA glycosylase [Cryptosporidium ubiquitum]OII74031.1 Uracil-DNA glycosylase [Cryptosporidium ubiquitum]